MNGTFTNSGDYHHGFLPRNVSWYRKHFKLPADAYANNTVWALEFEGTFHYTSIWINGKHIMDHSLARDPSFFFIPSSVPRLEVKEEAGGMLQPPPPLSLSLYPPLCPLSRLHSRLHSALFRLWMLTCAVLNDVVYTSQGYSPYSLVMNSTVLAAGTPAVIAVRTDASYGSGHWYALARLLPPAFF